MSALQWAPDASCVAFSSAWQVHLCSVPGMQTRSISIPFDICHLEYGSKVRFHQLCVSSEQALLRHHQDTAECVWITQARA